MEIIVEQLRPLREHGDGLVGAHRADGVVPILRHRLQEELDIFLGVAEGLLTIEERRGFVRRCDQRRFGKVGQLMQLELRMLQPFLIGLGFRECALDLFIFDDAALFRIDEEHLAGLQPPFANDLFFGNRKHAAFRSHDDVIIVRDDEARRP